MTSTTKTFPPNLIYFLNKVNLLKNQQIVSKKRAKKCIFSRTFSNFHDIINLKLMKCVLASQVLKYELQAPFDKLLSYANYKKWKEIAPENLEEFER